MSFAIITNSTTISATELNNNFYHIGQGDLLPMGGVSLTAETGQHNLGSSGNQWRSIYVNEIAGTLTVSAPMTFNAPVTFNTTTSFPSGFLGYYPYIMAWEIYPTSTNAPVGTSGAYVARALNTSTVYNLAGASLSSSQVSLPAGTYEVEAWGSGVNQNSFKVRLYNVTDATTIALGTPGYNTSLGDNGSPSMLWARFSISSAKTFELQMRSSLSGVAMGLGTALSKGVFAYLEARKVV